MIKICLVVFFLIICVTGNDSVRAADWRFPVGYTFANGINKLENSYTENLEEEGYSVQGSFMNYGGISFNPYVELDMGLRFGIGFGPLTMILNTVEYQDTVEFESSHFEFPVIPNIGWTILPKHNTSPYLRAGYSYHIASGTYLTESRPGLMGAVGVEFFRKKMVGMGIELGIDKAEVEIEKRRCAEQSYWDSKCDTVVAGTETINPIGVMISIFAVF